MTITRSFGMVIEGGMARHWYAGADGVRRWLHNDKPVDSDANFIAAMSAGIPPLTTPDPLSADEEEHGVCAMGELPELSPAQLAEGDITSERL